jgi:hypothetical protein
VIPSSLMPYCAAVSQHPKVHQEIHAAGSGLCHPLHPMLCNTGRPWRGMPDPSVHDQAPRLHNSRACIIAVPSPIRSLKLTLINCNPVAGCFSNRDRKDLVPELEQAKHIHLGTWYAHRRFLRQLAPTVYALQLSSWKTPRPRRRGLEMSSKTSCKEWPRPSIRLTAPLESR